ESFPEAARPAYTTVQTIIYRLEAKKAVRRVKKIGNALIFEAALSRVAAQRRLIHDFLAMFDGRAQPVMAALIQTGQLTREDVREAERLLDDFEKKENEKKRCPRTPETPGRSPASPEGSSWSRGRAGCPPRRPRGRRPTA